MMNNFFVQAVLQRSLEILTQTLLVVSSGVQFLLHFDAVEDRRNIQKQKKSLIKHTLAAARGVQEFCVCAYYFALCFLAAASCNN